LDVEVTRPSPSLQVLTGLVDKLDVFVNKAQDNLRVRISEASTHLHISCGVVCAINDTEYIIRFEKATLLWEENDNREGVTKYNTLIASGKWSLEEIEIEELL
jgi:hypothetical protein